MNTLKSHVSENDVIGSIRQQLRHPSGVNRIWIIVEGADDEKLFKKLIDGPHVKIEFNPNGGGKIPLLRTVAELLKETDRILGIRDADFLYLEGKRETNQNIFLTDFHDAEMMIISCDDAYHAVVAEYLSVKGNPSALREKILKSVRFIGGLRWINDAESLGLNFKNLGFGNFYDGENFILDENNFLQSVMKRSPGKKRDVSREDVTAKTEDVSDLPNLCNGHDFQKAFALRVFADSKKGIKDAEIGKAFRVAYRLADFQKTNLYKQLGEWSNRQSCSLFRQT
ncbi:MAG: hypothetical protein B6245_21840 [Desulfobacteraceae bacterium 4572_88]|nr:MAG: hypothetical protein B6245_21840 [Desulfobacteraceae bacterium 4572_88]RLC03626.1 MAG: hypothetical protein DRI57_28935 [Deltaproteobacteria bacterium]